MIDMLKNANTESALRTFASTIKGVTEGVACKGTALESTTFNRGKNSFLFLKVENGRYSIRLKLEASREEASKHYKVGAKGWATLQFTEESAPPIETLKRWITESHKLAAK